MSDPGEGQDDQGTHLTYDREMLQLAQQLQQKGVRSGLDAENAAAQVEGIRAQLPSLRKQEIQYLNAIALLLDLPPTALNAELSPRHAIPRSPPRVLLGIPSELARRRPDIREPEGQLHAATANIGVAIAVDRPIIAQTKSRLTISQILRLVARRDRRKSLQHRGSSSGHFAKS